MLCCICHLTRDPHIVLQCGRDESSNESVELCGNEPCGNELCENELCENEPYENKSNESCENGLCENKSNESTELCENKSNVSNESYELCELCESCESEPIDQFGGHVFCVDCIWRWLEPGNSSCPMCRRTIAAHEVERIITMGWPTNMRKTQFALWQAKAIRRTLPNLPWDLQMVALERLRTLEQAQCNF